MEPCGPDSNGPAGGAPETYNAVSRANKIYKDDKIIMNNRAQD